jgi:UDP-GlcNAc:undecaprenyl-phosphate GlcNAc-1-phosphate transferase
MTPAALAIAISLLTLGAFLVSVAATAGMIRLAPRIGLVDKPGHRKIHHVPKPLGGGVGIFLGVAAPMLVGIVLVLPYHNADLFSIMNVPWTSGSVAGEGAFFGLQIDLALLRGAAHQVALALGFLAGGLAMFLLGLIDDRKALGPFIKLFVQLAVSAWFVWQFDVRLFTFLDDNTPLGVLPSVLITVLWIAGVTNAFNFLDNMDGLSAGVACVCAIIFLVAALIVGQLFVAAALALLVGALLGFLVHNFPPARIFMGDSGALFIGFVLGVLTVRTTYLLPGEDFAAGWYSVLVPVIVLALPLYDMLVVSAIRISRGRSPFVGDTNHFSHRLVARGMSRRTAVLSLYLITAATGVAAILLPLVETTFAAMLILVQTVLILCVVALLEQHPLPRADEAAAPLDAPPRS